MGPGPPLPSFPFHCWTSFRTSPDYQLYDIYHTGRPIYRGYTANPPPPVSLLDIPDVQNCRHTFELRMPEYQKELKDTSLANEKWRID